MCEDITFSIDFNQELEENNLQNCKSITFGVHFNNGYNFYDIGDTKPFKCILPNCENITFGERFNQELKENILPNCKDIKFGKNYNNDYKPFKCILPNCENITFGERFNQELEENILPNCKDIKFGIEYNNGNNPFKCILPNCKNIKFYYKFKVDLSPTILHKIENILILIRGRLKIKEVLDDPQAYYYYILKDKKINHLVLHDENLTAFNNIKTWLEINKGRFITETEPEAVAAQVPVIVPVAGGYYIKYMKYKNKYLQLKQKI